MDANAFFQADWVLKNDKVLLRPLRESDFTHLLPIAVEPELWQFGLIQIVSPSDLQNYIAEALHQREQHTTYPFVVIDVLTQAYVGCTRLYNIAFEHKRATIGFTWISRAARGTGVNAAQKLELLQFVFETLQFERVEFNIDALNLRSRRAVEKLGAIEEGVLRKHMITYTGRVRDTVVASIVKAEWPQAKANLLSQK